MFMCYAETVIIQRNYRNNDIDLMTLRTKFHIGKIIGNRRCHSAAVGVESSLSIGHCNGCVKFEFNYKPMKFVEKKPIYLYIGNSYEKRL